MELFWFGPFDLTKPVGVANMFFFVKFICSMLGVDVRFLSILHIV